jgi:SAM-dependent methyltransferase
MTRLPLDGPPFDVVYFGSVFTHLYPREIAALLRETRRLLAPAGFVLADAFVAPAGPRWSGHRGMVVVREAVLHATFAASGLRAVAVRRWPWQDGVWRAIYRFAHPTPV